MTYIQIQQMAACLRQIPLEAVLQTLGAQQDRYDKAKWHTAKGVLSVTGMKFINWKEARGGGGAIDLAMHLNNMGFKTALQWLSTQFPVAPPPQFSEPPSKPTLRLPPKDRLNLTRVLRYLIAQRRLDPGLLDPLIQSGTLYADQHANAVFLLLGKEKTPVGAELRGTGQHPWKGMAPGSNKNAGFFSLGATPPHSVILCESAIDAISCVALNPDSWCISTSGVRPNPPWLSRIVATGCTIFCGFDTDSAGENAAQTMIALHPRITRYPPPGHDWNLALTSRF